MKKTAKKTKKPTKAAATVVLIRASEFTQKGANQIAGWLERQAKALREKGERENYAPRYTARWWYR